MGTYEVGAEKVGRAKAKVRAKSVLVFMTNSALRVSSDSSAECSFIEYAVVEGKKSLIVDCYRKGTLVSSRLMYPVHTRCFRLRQSYLHVYRAQHRHPETFPFLITSELQESST